MLSTTFNSTTRAWLTRVALSLAIALAAGALAYLIARAITSVALLVRQQQLLREVTGALRGGIEGLAGGDLRAVRLLLQQIDARNEQLSLVIGFVVAAVAAVVSYLWLERWSASGSPQGRV
jgi:cytochrome c-type biogenesis protein CcmH/NrfG